MRHGTEGGGEAAKGRGAVAALLAVLLISASRDAFVLLQYPVAVGIDGYYYVLQIQGLLTRGQLYFSTGTPFVFYAIAPLSILTHDTVLAVKIGSIAFHLALCAGLYALVSGSTGSRWLGVLAGSTSAVSATHFYMVAEFVKNLCALALLLWGWWVVVQSPRRRRAPWTIAALVLFIAAVCSHRSAWALTSAMLTFHLLIRSLFTGGPFNRRKALALVAAISLAISPAVVAAQPFVELPGWLGKEVLTRPRWPINMGSPFGVIEMTALLLISPLTLFLLKRFPECIRPAPHFITVTGGVALWSLLVTLNPFLNHDVRQLGIVGRLDHLMYVQLSILIPSLTWLISRVQRKALVILLPLIAMFVAASGISPLPKGLSPSYLSNRLQMMLALPEHGQQLGPNPLIVARHGDEFVVTWVLRIPAQHRLPDNTDGRTVYWLLHHVEQADLTNSMIVVTGEGDDFCLAFVRHDELTPWLNTVTDAEKKRLLTFNPELEEVAPSGEISGAQ